MAAVLLLGIADSVLGEIFARGVLLSKVLGWVAGRAAVSESRVKGLTARAGISERQKARFLFFCGRSDASLFQGLESKYLNPISVCVNGPTGLNLASRNAH
ncbi:hypothetical protein [Bradyrhizobium sp. CCBAU 53380]|uniref:hypothetical protein n=1 Tax=Bradyrhizobium sp. CCBAU 53380 TaxID=1325117 RepID=UPI002304194A|nr:hypothetical protein [Bradyrhizobium sp. CCBAU 53380]